MHVLVGTQTGLVGVGDGPSALLGGHDVVDLAVDEEGVWALVDGEEVVHSARGAAFEPVGSLGADAPEGKCLLPTPQGILVGTAEAHLVRIRQAEGRRIPGFDDAPGRDRWYTPWGGPPDVRSLARAADGSLFVNVHVGGILRSTDGGDTWAPTDIDVDADVHEVLTAGDAVLAACAVGLARSTDAGGNWSIADDGLHATYARALAVSGDAVVMSASTGPSTTRGALYRRPLDRGAFEKLDGGLPEWFEGNVDTGWLDAQGPLVAAGTPSGELYTSEDGGTTWTLATADLGAIRCVRIVR